MAFLIATGGMTLIVFVGVYLMLRSEKKQKRKTSHSV
jgi:DNA-binding sugar fermentation-stimulating protein